MGSHMKQWPADGSTLNLKDLVDPLVDAFEQCYTLTRKNETLDFIYKGYDFGTPEKASNPPLADILKATNLASSGETPLRAILSIATNLGIEQGRRLYLEKTLLTRDFNEVATPAITTGSLLAWPADKRQAVDFEKLTKPLVRATKHYYNLKRKNADKDVDYKGYNTGHSTRVCSPPPDETLTVNGLAYHQERDRTPVDMLITIAVQLGMEQGERLMKQDPQMIALEKKRKELDDSAERLFDTPPSEETKAKLRKLFEAIPNIKPKK